MNLRSTLFLGLLPLTLFFGSSGCGSDGTNSGSNAGPSGSGGEGAASPAGTGGNGGDAPTASASGSPTSSSGTAGAGSYTVDSSIESWHEPALKASIHFAPSDDLEAEVLAQLGRATQSLRLAFFNVRLDSVKNLLAQKLQAGVDVHVVLDKKQQDLPYNTMAEELEALGVPVDLVDNVSATDATLHDKFSVVDGHLVMTGSANYSTTALHVSDEDLLTFDDPAIAKRYLDEFDELVQGGVAESAPYPAGAPMKAWMGPEDGLDDRAEELLVSAQSHALVAMFQLNRQSLVDALIDAHGRGVKVVVVLDQVQAEAPDSADEVLVAAGIPVVLAHNTGNMAAEMHSKLLVVDHKRFITGSYNWTNLGSFYNDENIMVIDDAHLAARAEGKLAELLQAYPAPSPSSLGLDTGPQSVTFEVTNVSLDPGVVLTIESKSGGFFATPVELGGTSLTMDIEAGTRVEYRYEIRSGAQSLLLEKGTHAFTVPYAPGPFVVKDAFVP